MCFSPQRRAIFRHQNFKKCSRTPSFLTFWLRKVLFATAACNFSTSELQKVLSDPQFFKHFHFHMCFSPQRRAIFRHLNFKKCSRNAVFCTFSLPNALFATAACTFSTSELQKVLRGPQFLNILTSKCAFRHSGVQFLISATSAPAALTGLLLDWPDTRIIEKTQHFATSLTFGADVSSFFWLSRYCIFFLLTWLLYSAFSTVHIVGSFYLNFLRLDVYIISLVSQVCLLAPRTTPKFDWIQSTLPSALGWEALGLRSLGATILSGSQASAFYG